MEALYDIKITDTDVPSHCTCSPEAILETGAKEKKRIYEQAVVERRGNFTPIVLSVDGLQHREAEHFLKRIAANLGHKPYSQIYMDMLRPDLPENSSVIVAGSVIQLFCSASGQFTAPHIQWTWNNITIPETSQLPHLMVKSWTENNTITSSVLTIYGFSTSNNGSYQCNASDNGSSDISQPLLLTGKYHRFSTSSTPLFYTAINGSNVLTIIQELNNNIELDRISVPFGSSNISPNGSFLRCSAQQPPLSSLTAPSTIWLKDGT